jgi:hypothetical protein
MNEGCLQWIYFNAVFTTVAVYVILGHQDEHLGLMIAMEELKLFDKGKITIIKIFLMTSSCRQYWELSQFLFFENIFNKIIGIH